MIKDYKNFILIKDIKYDITTNKTINIPVSISFTPTKYIGLIEIWTANQQPPKILNRCITCTSTIFSNVKYFYDDTPDGYQSSSIYLYLNSGNYSRGNLNLTFYVDNSGIRFSARCVGVIALS